MGVRGIWKLTLDGVPITKFVTSVKTFKGKRICVDASNIIYAVRESDVLQRVLDVVVQFGSQVWIFDSGLGHPLKKRGKKTGGERETEGDGEKDDGEKLPEKHDTIAEVKRLLDLMGIIHATTAPGIEAEHLCAALTKPDPNGDRFCDYCLSADSDVLPYGGVMLRMLKSDEKPTNKDEKGGEKKENEKKEKKEKEEKEEKIEREYEVYDIDDVLRGLGIGLQNFRKVCVLIGCDYCDRTLEPKLTTKLLKETELTGDQKAALAEYSKDITGDVRVTRSEPDRSALAQFLAEKKLKAASVDI